MIFVRAWIAAATVLVVCRLRLPARCDRSGSAAVRDRTSRRHKLPWRLNTSLQVVATRPCRAVKADPPPNEDGFRSIAISREAVGTTDRFSCERVRAIAAELRRRHQGPCGVGRRARRTHRPASRFHPAKRKTAVSSRGAARSWQRRATTSSTTTANYYTRDTLGEFIVILAPAAVFANSDWDADVGNWYQEHVRSNATNRAADLLPAAGKRLLHDTRLCFRQVPGRILRRPARHGAVGRIRRSHHAGLAGGRSALVGRAIPDRRRAAVGHTRTNRTGGRFTAPTAPAAMPSWARCPFSPWPA